MGCEKAKLVNVRPGRWEIDCCGDVVGSGQLRRVCDRGRMRLKAGIIFHDKDDEIVGIQWKEVASAAQGYSWLRSIVAEVDCDTVRENPPFAVDDDEDFGLPEE